MQVNAIAQNFVENPTYFPPAVQALPAFQDRLKREVPLGRLGVATDIAQVVLFLASDAAGYVTGQNLVVDGGVTGSVIAHLPRPAAVDSVGHRE